MGDLNSISRNVCFCIHQGKFKSLKMSTAQSPAVLVENKALDEVGSVTYLGSIWDREEGTEANVEIRIGKARVPFRLLSKVRRATIISLQTKVILSNSFVKSVLL